MAKDPVCGMRVDERKPMAKFVYKGVTYYFCSHPCKEEFELHPGKYATVQSAEK